MNPITISLPVYKPVIVPGLHHIQDEFGYLNRNALEQFGRANDLPLFRLQAVASFFPHFRLEKPPEVTVRVCRDMACHLAGSAQIIKSLQSLEADPRIKVEGASCLGRCDRAPAACVTLHGAPAPAPAGAHAGNGAHAGDPAHPVELAPAPEHAHEGAGAHEGHGAHDGHAHGGHGHAAGRDLYYFGQRYDGLKRVSTDCLKGGRPASNFDNDRHILAQSPDQWMIDPYKGGARDYKGVQKAVALRRQAIAAAAAKVRQAQQWSASQEEAFIAAADGRLPISASTDDGWDRDVLDAVRDWQVEDNWADALFKELDDAHADLRGMGGAGIPATQKWKDVREAVRNLRRRKADDDRAFIVVNGDESEPATFKDRELLLRTPHLIVEGVILAGLATEATQGFIYIRHEYPEQIAACNRAIADAERQGFCGEHARALGRAFKVEVFPSPGGYICGEQSALIEAMEDRRGEPRNMPPKLETNGLQDRPTLVSNVETYGWVPYIWVNGGENYAKLGINGCKGRRFFSISGDVKRPGVYEVPMGLPLRELICGEQYCQGIRGGKKLKALAPSGPSGGFLPARLTADAGLPSRYTTNKTWLEIAKRCGFDPAAKELDILDLTLELNVFRALSPTQALGAGIVVYDETRDMVDQMVNSLEFYRNESCGKCVPCRIGSQKLAALGSNLLAGKIQAQQWEQELLPTVKELGDVMALASICGLGRSVPVPVKTVIEMFPADLARYTRRGAQAPHETHGPGPGHSDPAIDIDGHDAAAAEAIKATPGPAV